MKKLAYSSFILLIAALGSCKKSDNTTTTPTPTYTVPTTYNFTNVSYSDQTMLLAMADQLVATINTGNISGTKLSAQTLDNMFNNTNSPFNDSALKLNESNLKLSAYFSPVAVSDMEAYFDSISTYSSSTAAATQGVAGVAPSSASPTKKFLLSPTGLFYSQVVKKSIMWGLCAYQITNIMNESNTVDNSNVVANQGTAMEHHWDEAFGFFGVPVDFPTNVKGLKYFGSYSNQVDAGLHSNSTIMNAFLKGRAAISGKDLTTRQSQATLLVSTFDQLNAACIIQEMKETDANIDAGDAVAAYGTLSETLGFVHNLKYNTNSTRKITDAQINQLMALFDSANPNNPNLYNFIGSNISSAAQIKAKTDAIRQFIGGIYGFDAATLALL